MSDLSLIAWHRRRAIEYARIYPDLSDKHERSADAIVRLTRELERLREIGEISKRDLLRSSDLRIDAEAARDEARAALSDIARQKLTSELDDLERCDGDFEGAYDTMIGVARAAHHNWSSPPKEPGA